MSISPAGPWSQRLAANLGLLWTERPLVERIARAADAGFPAVELHHPAGADAADVAAACARAGVRLLGVNSGPAAAGRPSEAAAFREEFESLLAWCVEAGASAIHVLAGFVAQDSRGAGLSTLLCALEWAAELAAAKGIGLLLEPLNRYDRPGYLYHRPEEVAAIVRSLGRDNVGLQFDAYHAAREGLDPAAAVAAHLDVVRHVQIAASPDRGEPDRGDVDFADFLERLDRLGYRGWIGCEYVPRTTAEDGMGWRDALIARARGS